MGVKDLVKRALTEKENRAYARRLRERKMAYPDWVVQMEADGAEEESGSEKADTGRDSDPQRNPEDQPRDLRTAVDTDEDFVVICASAGALRKNSLKEIGRYFIEHPKVQLLYGDEDIWPEDDRITNKNEERRSPWFKPDWSPDLLDSCLYFGSVTALRRALFDKAKVEFGQLSGSVGERPAEIFFKGNREGVDYEVRNLNLYAQWLKSCMMLAGAYEKGSAVVGHIPRILFHGEKEEAQGRFLEDISFLKSRRGDVREFRKRWEQLKGREERPLVSVVIPSKDQPEVLEKCLQGCRLAGGVGYEDGSQDYWPSDHLPLEVLLVDNGSSPDNRERVQTMVREMDQSVFRIRYLYRPMEFNFSKMCNLGAKQASGEFLLFLNDDVELCRAGCIETMAALAERPFTGAVGMKLLYPDSARIQHVGITNLPMGPVHKLQFLNDDVCYYYKTNRGRRNVLAVTAACLMVQKEKFLEAGGFAEELQVAFNDVDLCFRLHELGYWNVCVNDWHAYHHESLSRGDDESPEKLERLFKERDRLYSRHPMLAERDPFYSIHLNRDCLDTRIRPAYVSAGNRPQQVQTALGQYDPAGSRQDPCLLVRIEDCRVKRIQGYGVVLGDNNACYEFRLLFRLFDLSTAQTDGCSPNMGNGETYAIELAGQYRPDLEENMSDQVNVALNGFAVELEGAVLPAGRYQLGIAARNRITGLKLINWSNRYLVMES